MDDKFKNNIDKPTNERRKFPRLQISVDTEYTISLDNVSAQKQTIKTKNISIGGICIIVYEDVKTGSILDLKFKLSNNNSVIEAKGIVVWTNSFKISTEDKTNYELGIEFTKISDIDRDIISKYILSFK